MGPALPLNITESDSAHFVLWILLREQANLLYYTLLANVSIRSNVVFCCSGLLSDFVGNRVIILPFDLFLFLRESELDICLGPLSCRAFLLWSYTCFCCLGGIYGSDWLAFWVDLAMSCGHWNVNIHDLKKKVFNF